MKSTGLFLKYLLVATIMANASCCKKNPGCTSVNATNYNANAQVDNGTCLYASTFYFDQYGPKATVAMNNVTGIVTSSYPHGAPVCGLTATGCANFNLPIGTYSYTASSSLAHWSGSLTVNDGGCASIVLHQSHGVVVFYDTVNYGAVVVNVNGVIDTITNNITSANPDCGTSGCATFNLDPYITYSYTATSTSGKNWSGTVKGPGADTCSSFLLR